VVTSLRESVYKVGKIIIFNIYFQRSSKLSYQKWLAICIVKSKTFNRKKVKILRIWK